MRHYSIGVHTRHPFNPLKNKQTNKQTNKHETKTCRKKNELFNKSQSVKPKSTLKPIRKMWKDITDFLKKKKKKEYGISFAYEFFKNVLHKRLIIFPYQ